MKQQLRELQIENAALKLAMSQAGREGHAKVIADYARQRILLADVHTSLIAAGWHEDSLLNRIKQELAP